ncbi:ATP-binding protein [Serratia symbiotica]|uniref:ATP-binding protein n=1 Tax=Serratia symbiotica TaxID=138074 RepID=UPI0020900848|nr:ATP-binding protein [Serratia symbiotica]USS95154.1 ATP-binding protein [Serratia symbiotica]
MTDIHTLERLLRKLRLTRIASEWHSQEKRALAEGWTRSRYLLSLCSEEATHRESERLRRYIKDARLPVGKTLAEYDFGQVSELNEVLLKLARYRVIVIDDLGYVKRDNAETGVLFELIAHRYERGSLIITSNHPFSTWGNIFVDETMAVAAADRLIHHGYIFEVTGESYRKKMSKAAIQQSAKQ